MTVALPGSSKKTLRGLFKKRKDAAPSKPSLRKPLKGAELAKLFDKQPRDEKPATVESLTDVEQQEAVQMSHLRSALHKRR